MTETWNKIGFVYLRKFSRSDFRKLGHAQKSCTVSSWKMIIIRIISIKLLQRYPRDP